jgi:hypothetical protein
MSDDGARELVARRIQAYRNGEDPELTALLEILWRELYAQIPRLTRSRAKDDQHRVLEKHLQALGLPKSADLQYVVGPLLWFAREKGVIPPAQPAGADADPWTLDEKRHAAVGAALGEGLVAYGDWMRDALKTVLFEQQ